MWDCTQNRYKSNSHISTAIKCVKKTRPELAADVPDRLHGVPFVMHKGGECLDDSHEAGKRILISM